MEERFLEHGGQKLIMSSRQDKQRLILSLTVEIQDGREEHIEVKEGDSAGAVAKRFVNEHGLPQQFEAPLAELIVDNIIRLSKNDNWRKENQRPSKTRKEPTSRESSSHGKRAVQVVSDKANERTSTNKYKGRRMSERLLAHTYTFRAKTSVFGHLEERKKPKQRPLSEREKSLFMRLHMDFMRHKQKIEEGRRLMHEQYVERLGRAKVRISKRSKIIMQVRGTAAKQFHNYGELLYQEGLNKQHERDLQIQKKKQEDEANALKGLTLKPEISKVSKELKNKEAVWERLRHNKYAEHLQALRNEALEAQLMECTFKPRINDIISERREGQDEKQVQMGSRFDQLFWDAEIRRRRQAEYTQWYPEGVTFRPSISKSQHSHPDTHEEEDRGRSVFARLLEYAERTNQLKQKLLEDFSRPVDPMTGQELFRPLTGRKPQIERNSSLLPIGEFLYQLHFDLYHKKKTKLENNMQEYVKLANLEYVSPRSTRLLKDLESRSLRQIFYYLDKDKAGVVNLETAVTEALIDEVVEDINDVKNSGKPVTSLSYEAFAQLLGPVRKAKKRGIHLVLKTRRADDPFKTFTFRFRMSPYSRALAIRRRKYKGTHQWYKILRQERGRRHTKIEGIQKDLQHAEMKECSFKPVIHSKRGKSFLKMHYLPRNSPRMDKEHQEVHGFIFKEDGERWRL